MYPSGELTRLATRKTLLQARIAIRRWECAAAASELARPIALVDRGLDLWKRFAPFIKLLGVPATLLVLKKFRRGPSAQSKAKHKRSKIGALFSALPVILRGIRMVTALRGTYGTHNGQAEAAPPSSRQRTARPSP